MIGGIAWSTAPLKARSTYALFDLVCFISCCYLMLSWWLCTSVYAEAAHAVKLQNWEQEIM